MKAVVPSDQNPRRLPFLSQSLSSVSSCCWFFSFWDTLVFCHVILQEVALALGRMTSEERLAQLSCGHGLLGWHLWASTHFPYGITPFKVNTHAKTKLQDKINWLWQDFGFP